MHWYYIRYNNKIPICNTRTNDGEIGDYGPHEPPRGPRTPHDRVSTGREPGRSTERMGALYMARRKLGLDNRPEAPEAAQVSIMTAVVYQGGAMGSGLILKERPVQERKEGGAIGPRPTCTP